MSHAALEHACTLQASDDEIHNHLEIPCFCPSPPCRHSPVDPRVPRTHHLKDCRVGPRKSCLWNFRAMYLEDRLSRCCREQNPSWRSTVCKVRRQESSYFLYQEQGSYQ